MYAVGTPSLPMLEFFPRVLFLAGGITGLQFDLKAVVVSRGSCCCQEFYASIALQYWQWALLRP